MHYSRATSIYLSRGAGGSGGGEEDPSSSTSNYGIEIATGTEPDADRTRISFGELEQALGLMSLDAPRGPSRGYTTSPPSTYMSPLQRATPPPLPSYPQPPLQAPFHPPYATSSASSSTYPSPISQGSVRAPHDVVPPSSFLRHSLPNPAPSIASYAPPQPQRPLTRSSLPAVLYHPYHPPSLPSTAPFSQVPLDRRQSVGSSQSLGPGHAPGQGQGREFAPSPFSHLVTQESERDLEFVWSKRLNRVLPPEALLRSPEMREECDTFWIGRGEHVRVYEDGLEVFPWTANGNAWIKGQVKERRKCECGFSFMKGGESLSKEEFKRPATIKDHFINCSRMTTSSPMFKICKLLRDAEKGLKSGKFSV